MAAGIDWARKLVRRRLGAPWSFSTTRPCAGQTDIILLDIRLPDQDGLTIARRLRAAVALVGNFIGGGLLIGLYYAYVNDDANYLWSRPRTAPASSWENR